jgi:hypothetical protein
MYERERKGERGEREGGKGEVRERGERRWEEREGGRKEKGKRINIAKVSILAELDPNQ